MKRTFTVKALWDASVDRWVSGSDIRGLVIDAATLEAFEQVIEAFAVEIILANHFEPAVIADTPLRDLVPTIIWQRPDVPALSA